MCIYTHDIVYCLFCLGVPKASGEVSVQEGHPALPLGHAQTCGAGLPTDVEPGGRVPSPDRVPAIGLPGGLAGQGVRVLGQDSDQLQTGIHSPCPVP